MPCARIMVVEDEAITAKDLEARLQRLGYGVAALAASGEEALEKAAKTKPDLVLMDIKLKGAMDGVQVAHALNTRWGIPVTYLTAYADDATLARAELTTPYGYLVKPFDERALHATIQMALYRRQVEKQAEEANRLLGEVSESLLQLTPEEERLLRMRFGVSTGPLGAAQVAKRLQVETARVRQRHARRATAARALGAPEIQALSPEGS